MHVRGAKCASSVELLLEAEGTYSNKIIIIIIKIIQKILQKKLPTVRRKRRA
jgi:hypothetical protein